MTGRREDLWPVIFMWPSLHLQGSKMAIHVLKNPAHAGQMVFITLLFGKSELPPQTVTTTPQDSLRLVPKTIK
jgi:hypothetical protein